MPPELPDLLRTTVRFVLYQVRRLARKADARVSVRDYLRNLFVPVRGIDTRNS